MASFPWTAAGDSEANLGPRVVSSRMLRILVPWQQKQHRCAHCKSTGRRQETCPFWLGAYSERWGARVREKGNSSNKKQQAGPNFVLAKRMLASCASRCKETDAAATCVLASSLSECKEKGCSSNMGVSILAIRVQTTGCNCNMDVSNLASRVRGNGRKDKMDAARAKTWMQWRHGYPDAKKRLQRKHGCQRLGSPDAMDWMQR